MKKSNGYVSIRNHLITYRWKIANFDRIIITIIFCSYLQLIISMYSKRRINYHAASDLISHLWFLPAADPLQLANSCPCRLKMSRFFSKIYFFYQGRLFLSLPSNGPIPRRDSGDGEFIKKILVKIQ